MSDDLRRARIDAWKLLLQWSDEHWSEHLLFYAYDPNNPNEDIIAAAAPEEYNRLEAEYAARGWTIVADPDRRQA